MTLLECIFYVLIGMLAVVFCKSCSNHIVTLNQIDTPTFLGTDEIFQGLSTVQIWFTRLTRGQHTASDPDKTFWFGKETGTCRATPVCSDHLPVKAVHGADGPRRDSARRRG